MPVPTLVEAMRPPIRATLSAASLAIDGAGCTLHLAAPGAGQRSCHVVAFEGGVICRTAPPAGMDLIPGIVHRRERRPGALRRVVRIGAAVDRDRVASSVVDGLLAVRLPWSGAAPHALPGPFPAGRAEARIPVDVYETGSRVILLADIPGVAVEDVTIAVGDGVLELDAHFPDPRRSGATVLWSELPMGRMVRRIALPPIGEPLWVAHDLQRGMLRIELGKGSTAGRPSSAQVGAA